MAAMIASATGSTDGAGGQDRKSDEMRNLPTGRPSSDGLASFTASTALYNPRRGRQLKALES